MCWFKDCEKINKLQEELESTKRMLSKSESRTDEWRNLWLRSRKEIADLFKPQWIAREHALPKDGQRVNVVAYMGQYGYKERTIADYCACKGFTHPFESLYPAYRTMQVMYWSPIPEMIEEITEEMKGMR